MTDLKDWAQHNSPFLKIEDNGEVIVIYKGYKEVEDQRNPGRTKIRYTFILDGEEKWFESAATAVAIALSECSEGDIVRIQKTKEGEKTRYIATPEEKQDIDKDTQDLKDSIDGK
jgi:hypothetical protein